MTQIKDAKLPKDEDKRAQEKAQAIHDKYIQTIDKLLKEKQQQLRK
jgi:ribosome recycling factor